MILRTLRFVGAAALLAVPSALAAQDPTRCTAADDREITSLSFEGNEYFDDARLANGIITEQSSFFRRVFRVVGRRRCFDQAVFANDLLRLLGLYRLSGFLEVQIDTIVERPEPGEIKIEFVIREGSPVIVEEFEVVGLDSVASRADILEHLPLAQGDPYNRPILRATQDTITRRLRNTGYPAAEVLLDSSYVDPAARRAMIRLRATPGTRAVLGAISVTIRPREGAGQAISESRARRFLGVEEGDLYREDRLERARRNTYLTGAYRTVTVDVDSTDAAPPGDSAVRVHVGLTEDFMRSARLGGGYGTLDCFRAEGEFSHLNFLKSARRFDARARVSKIGIGQPLSGAEGLCWSLKDDPYSVDLNYQLSVSIAEPIPSFLGTRPSATIFTEKRSEYKAFLRETRIGLVLSTTRESPRRSLTFAYQAENGRTEAQPAIFCALQNVCVAEDREPLLSYRWSGTLSATYAQRWYDDPQYPTKRATAQAELRHASKVTGSDPSIQFNRATVDVSGEISLGAGLVFAPRIRAGAVVGPAFRGTSRFIPSQERLYGGGGQTVRGFDQNDLGPRVYIARGYDTVRAEGAAGDITPDEEVFFRARTGLSAERSVPTGGSALLVGNAELRAPFPGLRDLVQVVGFVDVGELWSPGAERAEDRFTSLKYTPGVGFRIFTAVGAIRVDIAYNKYPQRAGAAYFDTPVEQGGQLFCVSPGNTLVVTGLGSGGTPAQASGACPADFQPPSARGFFRRLNLTLAIGQAY